MFAFNHRPDAFERLAKTGFLTSLIAYGVFGLLEFLRPGFVAHYLSVHLFLGTAIIFGFGWAAEAKTAKDRYVIQHLAAALLGIPMFVICWQFGGGLAEYRILTALLAAIVPLIVLRLVRS